MHLLLGFPVSYPISSPQNQTDLWRVHGAAKVEMNLEPRMVAHRIPRQEEPKLPVSLCISRACLKGEREIEGRTDGRGKEEERERRRTENTSFHRVYLDLGCRGP